MTHGQKGTRALLWIIWILALLLIVGLALDFSPWLRGDLDWRWAYLPVVVPERLLRVGLVLALYIGLAAGAWQWAFRKGGGRRVWWAVGFAALSGMLIQVAVQTVSNPDPWSFLFLRTSSVFLGGYHPVALEITDVGDWLRRFPELAPSYHTHAQRHPPGHILYFVGLQRLLAMFPGLSSSIADWLHLYRCEYWPLLYVSDAQFASVIGGLLTIPLNALTVFPLYAIGRRILPPRAALAAALISPLVPGYVLWAGIWDQALVLVTVLLLWLLHAALEQRRHWAWWAAGGLLSVATFFTHAMLVLLGFVVAYTGLHVWRRWLGRNTYQIRGVQTSEVSEARLSAKSSPIPRRFWYRRLSQRLPKSYLNSIGFLVGLSSLWLVYWLAFDVSWLDVYRANTAPHFALHTRYFSRLFYNPYDFVLFLGYPLGLLGLAALWRAGRRVVARRPLARADGVVLALAVTLAALTVSGVSRAEVGRVWMFLMPLAVLAAFAVEAGPARSVGRWAITATLLGAQILVMQAVLFSDRFAYHVYEVPSVAIPVGTQVGDAVELAGYEVDKSELLPGETLDVMLHWRVLQLPAGDYVVFAHLYAEELGVAAQRDAPPREGQYPTTCWQPGEMVSERIPLQLAPEAVPGVYELIVGLYDPAAANRRLPTTGPGARDMAIVLTEIEVLP